MWLTVNGYEVLSCKSLPCVNECIQSKSYINQYLEENWQLIERELTRERGLWGPPVGSDLDKWMLDMTEG